MSRTETIARHIRHIAWGYFLIYIHLKLNGWDVLVDFGGWYLIAKAITALKKEQSGLALLEGFAMGLGLWAFVNWLPFEWEGVLGELTGIIGLVVWMVRLYFHFQLLTELSRIALRYQRQKDHAGALLRGRTAVTVTEAVLVLTTALPLGEELLAMLSLPLMLAILGLCLYLMLQMFSLSNTLKGLKIDS